MKLIRKSNYILNTILSHLRFSRKLNFIRYNKSIQKKLGITLYTFQKKYFEEIISPALLESSEILLQNNIFDKKTLNKLNSDWKNDTTELIQEKDCFHFNQKAQKKNLKDIKILNISLKEKDLFKKGTPNLIELNISNIENLELPCSILSNLETLSLKDVSKIKFLNNKNKLSFNKLQHLYLNNISFDEENKIKINLNNLKYFDLRIKEQESPNDDIDLENFDNKTGVAGFHKEKTLQHLINIFDFEFLSVFKIDKSKSDNKLEKGEQTKDNLDNLKIDPEFDEEDNEDNEDFEEEDEIEKFEKLKKCFNKPKELFDKKYLYKYDYFNLEILYEYYLMCGSRESAQRFIYKYLFAKTKGNKYLFNTEYTNYLSGDGATDEVTNKEKRYCNKIDYDDYYFIINESEIGGNSIYAIDDDDIDYKNVNRFSIVSKYNEYSYGLVKIFEKFNENENRLEIISIEDLNLHIISQLDSFLKNLKKFQKLKCFYITKKCSFKNTNQLIDLLTTLSKIKSLLLIEIPIKGELKLSKSDEKKINKIFPDILIKKGNKDSYINWKNNNYEVKI